MSFEADSYLKSGSNELRILEYCTAGRSYGINILKVQKIVAQPGDFVRVMNTHPSIVGLFRDNGIIIPLVDLAHFLGYDGHRQGPFQGKIIVTEFFGVLNGFWVDSVEWIHHFFWEDVLDANSFMKSIAQKYVIGIVRPDGERMVPMLDYEAIILDICPTLGLDERQKLRYGQVDGRGLCVLIAEDSPSVRNMLAAEFGDFGFEVVAVGDGKEALDVLRSGRKVDMVISDIEMPRMDGLALTCAIRADTAINQLPVIVYSSIGDVGMKTRAQYLKANAHITKLNLDELMESVRQLCSQSATPLRR